MKGIGEKLEFISKDFHCYVLLVKPKKGVSTKKSFGMLDLKNAEHPPIMDMKEAIENNDYQGVVKCLGNTLEEPSLKIVPDILKIKEEMKELGFDGAFNVWKWFLCIWFNSRSGVVRKRVSVLFE